jgi:endonuclease/exonuclease/phosphatase (EEP) superfamily protein YafD
MNLRPLLLIAALILAALPSCGRPHRQPQKPSGAALRVITYNVNFGLAGDPATLRAITHEPADVVFLQETTPAWERVIRRGLSDRFPHMAFRHSGGAGGLAVLSRLPFDKLDYIASPGGWFPAWRVIVRSPLGRVQVLQLHLRPPVSDGGSVVSGYFTTPKFRRMEIEHFSRVLDARLPTLVVGDFNEDPDGRAIRFLRGRGLRSVLPEYQPGATTWRWNTSLGVQLTHTLDHIVYGPRLQPLEARVIRAGRSDHLPVLAIFQRS